MLAGFASSAMGADYPSTVLGDAPLAYYRFGEPLPVDVATNFGTLGVTGNGTYRDLLNQATVHRVTGALAGNGNAAASFQSSAGTPILVPYNATLNPSGAFTAEAWVRPTVDVSDTAGPCPLFNRNSNSPRQGWVFFQRSSGTGWNFRMYGNGVNTSTTLDITGGSFTVGNWVHLVATYDGTTARLYVNGAQVVSGSPSAYQGNSVAALAVGSYSDLNGSGPAYQNPFMGDVDEVALYSTALSAARVLTHYQNGLNPVRTTPYESLVASDGAVEYLRLNEPTILTDVAVNSGSLGPDLDGSYFPGTTHRVAGPLAGSSDTAAGYLALDSSSTDGGVPTTVPYNVALNPSSSFSIEAWLRPTIDGANNAQSPLFNSDSPTETVGWDFYQRNASTGWNFNMFNQTGGHVFDITGGSYTVGQWSHVVAVYNAGVPSATLYVNGLQVAQSTVPNGIYVPNPSYPFSIGGYADGIQNPFTGSIDEVALYSSALSPAVVLAHYINGTNSARSTPYESLVTVDGAVGYYRLNEAARNVAANSGTLGSAANAQYAFVTNGVYISATNTINGPQPPANDGFEPTNLASTFDGLAKYIEVNNPAGLNFNGQITLETWILPAASQGSIADIFAHGANEAPNEVALRIDGSGTQYTVLSHDSSDHGVSFPVPGGDLGGSAWVHLVGTYNGTAWVLYRNGSPVATNVDATGSITVNNANWAIGARGRWKAMSGLENQYSGNVDEAAIYNHALSASQIATHYSVGLASLTPLHITRSGGVTTITWSKGILQQADNVMGPYTDAIGAISPYIPPGGPTRKFYRLRF